MDDEALIGRCLAGDTEAFEGLLLAYQQPVYSLALRVTGNPDDAMDVAQEAFLKAFRSLHMFRRGSSFKPWLLTIAANAAMDHLRRQKPGIRDPLTVVRIPDPAPGPDELLEAADMRERLKAAITALAPDYRILVELFHVQGLSLSEVSRITGLNMTIVKNRLFRARKMLRDRLAGHSGADRHGEGGRTG